MPFFGFWGRPQEDNEEEESWQPGLDPAYQRWVELQRSLMSQGTSAGARAQDFWLIYEVDKQDFSERLEVHPEYPMFVPVPGAGRFLGVARDADQLQELTAPPLPDPRDEHETWRHDRRRQSVYLTYKVKIRGDSEFRKLLDLLVANGMLEEIK